MAHHTLKLNYDQKATRKFSPDVDPLPVEEGDTISFQLGIAPDKSTFKIPMNEPDFFSASEVKDSDTKIKVRAGLKKLTTYHCELFDSSGQLLFQSSEQQPGGGIRPGRP